MMSNATYLTNFSRPTITLLLLLLLLLLPLLRSVYVPIQKRIMKYKTTTYLRAVSR